MQCFALSPEGPDSQAQHTGKVFYGEKTLESFAAF